MSACPSCDRDDFTTERSMKIHHSKVHGESIAGVEVVCDWCDDTFRTKPIYVTEGGLNFCSEDCTYAYQRNDPDRRSNPWWDEDALTELYVEQELTTYEIGDHFGCSNEAIRRALDEFGIERRGRQYYTAGESNPMHGIVGEDNPRYNGGKAEYLCPNCGEVNLYYESQRGERAFCDNECRAEWLRENYVGENHPCWAGGWDNYYGPSWPRQRRAALKRDGRECIECGMSYEQHLKISGKGLHVHHVQKFRTFDSHEEANRLDNLVTLCNDHHTLWERASPLRPT